MSRDDGNGGSVLGLWRRCRWVVVELVIVMLLIEEGCCGVWCVVEVEATDLPRFQLIIARNLGAALNFCGESRDCRLGTSAEAPDSQATRASSFELHKDKHLPVQIPSKFAARWQMSDHYSGMNGQHGESSTSMRATRQQAPCSAWSAICSSRASHYGRDI